MNCTADGKCWKSAGSVPEMPKMQKLGPWPCCKSALFIISMKPMQIVLSASIESRRIKVVKQFSVRRTPEVTRLARNLPDFPENRSIARKKFRIEWNWNG